MGKALRFSEKWFRRGLWLVAVIFALFLIGLGGLVVQDLPELDPPRGVEAYLDAPAVEAVKRELRTLETRIADQEDQRARAALVHEAARNQTQSARETFANWLATRKATADAETDAALAQRTAELDALKAAERRAQAALEELDQALLSARQAMSAAQSRLMALENAARARWQADQRGVELRVFLLRLAITLPLLALAAWLFVRHRHGTHWPFVWGFVFFALFTFFVELVPYLPSYGGYVHTLVGIVLTLVGGHYAIRALNAYLARQKEAEARTESERRQAIDYEFAHARLAKGLCPGCERPVDLRDPARNFCLHCGIGLYTQCPACGARVNAFGRHCHACGARLGAVQPRT